VSWTLFIQIIMIIVVSGIIAGALVCVWKGDR